MRSASCSGERLLTSPIGMTEPGDFRRKLTSLLVIVEEIPLIYLSSTSSALSLVTKPVIALPFFMTKT